MLLATAWGPRFGGINAFNVELARSLGIVPGRRYGAVCVVPQATVDEVDDAQRHAVQLLSLRKPDDQTAIEPGDAAPVLQAVRQAIPDPGTVVWIGHDDKTGPAAVALRDLCPGSQVVLVHHMAFGAYQDFKKGDSASADEKRKMQRALFSQADLCLAVGPMLRDQLNDLLLSQPQAPAVDMLVPGLAEPDPTQVRLGDRPPKDFTAFLGGRLGSDDERIKQALLGVRGFGQAVKQAFAPTGPGPRHAIRRSPTLRMRGVAGPQHAALRQDCIDCAGGQVVNFDLANYTDDRHAYFGALAGSSVAMMPSWHEGFGLAAWEAIACQVPVVLGEQSGVFRLLNERCQGAGLGRGVRAVPVQGRLNRTPEEPPHTDADVAAVGQALFDLGDHMDESKASAVQLASILRHDFGFTWAACADQVVQSIAKHLGVALKTQPSAASDLADPVRDAEALPRPTGSRLAPDFLCPPQPRPRTPGLGDSPSALLVARDQVVRFDVAREPLIQDWLKRLDDPDLPQISLRLVVGEGGTGKTRSALELLRRAEARDGQRWTGLWMPAELPPDALAQWARHLAQAPKPVVLVVDYADGRQTALLQFLHAAYETARAHTVNPGEGESPWKLHLLCLARRSDWWPELQRADACSQDLAFLLAGPANLGVETLPDWPDDLPTRQRTYHAALRDYARAQGQSPPETAWAPRLEGRPYERPLYIHLAALAALAGARPEHAQALLADQVGREFRVWQRQASRPDEAPPRHADWAAVTAWSTLVQGGDSAAM